MEFCSYNRSYTRASCWLWQLVSSALWALAQHSYSGRAAQRGADPGLGMFPAGAAHGRVWVRCKHSGPNPLKRQTPNPDSHANYWLALKPQPSSLKAFAFQVCSRGHLSQPAFGSSRFCCEALQIEQSFVFCFVLWVDGKFHSHENFLLGFLLD